jgi:phosphonopyruvate decarboxylase
MIASEPFVDFLLDENISFFTGVPDSLLKELCSCITQKISNDKHIIASNEGAAIAIATGYHLATGNLPFVYLQNSGLGNAINPLLSLSDREVYSIPMLLMIGWRGEPGVQDEPQHVKQGKIQNHLLDIMEIPYVILDSMCDYESKLTSLIIKIKEQNRPGAVVVKKGTFEKYPPLEAATEISLLSREDSIDFILTHLAEDDIVVSTTGMASREIFEIRAKNKMGHHRDFLTVGSMGHCSQIALGLAMQLNNRKIYCIDGDGSLIMHMGSLSTIGTQQPKGFKHIVINNGAHDSVGGQPTAGLKINITQIALSCGYKEAKRIKCYEELPDAIKWLTSTDGPIMLEIIVKKGNRDNIGRPTKTPLQNKHDFMDYIKYFHEDVS